jgi:hypothetical protein
MYRQIFIPTEHNAVIPFAIPKEWYGKKVEIIVFPVPAVETKNTEDEEDFMNLSGAWESDKNAEEQIAELRAAKYFKVKDLSFDN